MVIEHVCDPEPRWSFLDVPMMSQPEAYIGNAAALFDAAGEVAQAETREFLQRYMAAFADWVGRHAAGR